MALDYKPLSSTSDTKTALRQIDMNFRSISLEINTIQSELKKLKSLLEE